MPADQDEIKRDYVINILNDIDDKNVHEAAQGGISPQYLADMLRPLAKDQIPALTQGAVKINEIEETFFHGRKSFSDQFGLILFPFFAFFDSMLERFRIEFTQSMRHASLGTVITLGFFSQKETEKKISAAFQQFSSAMQAQLSGMEHEGAEPFVSQLSAFLQCINQIPVKCQKAREEKDHFLYKIKDAHHQLFFSEGEQWEDTAVTAMGDVLGRMAQTAMPTERSFTLALKHLHNAALKKQIEKFIASQRTAFQENLVQFCKPVYENAVNAITAAWQTYKNEYVLRLNRLRDFLQNFPD